MKERGKAMRILWKKGKMFVVGLGLSLVPALAMATPPTDFEVPTISMTAYYTIGGAILAALATPWIARKLVKFMNRS